MSSNKDSRSVLVLLNFDEDPLEVVIYGLSSTIHETRERFLLLVETPVAYWSSDDQAG